MTYISCEYGVASVRENIPQIDADGCSHVETHVLLLCDSVLYICTAVSCDGCNGSFNKNETHGQIFKVLYLLQNCQHSKRKTATAV